MVTVSEPVLTSICALKNRFQENIAILESKHFESKFFDVK